MVRKTIYVCETFISRPIKNSTSGGQWQNKTVLEGNNPALRLAKCQINRAFRVARGDQLLYGGERVSHEKTFHYG